MVLGIFALIGGIGGLCWLVFNFAVYILPVMVGLNIGLIAYQTGAGGVGGAIVGLIAGALVYFLGQRLILRAPIGWPRMLASLVFVGPAAYIGFSLGRMITEQLMPSEIWQMVFSLAGGAIVGLTTYRRVNGYDDLQGY